MLRALTFAAALTLFVFAPHSANAQKQKEVDLLDPNPLFFPVKLGEKTATSAALSLCGGTLHSCGEAKEYLRTMTAQCSNVYLGVIDINQHPEVPLNLYNTKEPRLILLRQEKGLNSLVPFHLEVDTNPDTVAIVLCLKESHAFQRVMGFGPW